MPWEHCGAAIDDDDRACPSCGMKKKSWTLEWNVTRQFVIGKKGPELAFRLQLKAAGGGAVADEPFALTLPGGQVVQERLNRYGVGKVISPAEGAGEVSFPCRKAGDFAGATPLGAGDEARFRITTSAKAMFQLAQPAAAAAAAPPAEQPPERAWVEVELVDPEGRPVSGLRYELRLPDGSRRVGTLDATGRVRVEGIAPEPCELRLPDLDDRLWRAEG